MRRATSVSAFVLLALLMSHAQDHPSANTENTPEYPDAPSWAQANHPSLRDSGANSAAVGPRELTSNQSERLNLGGKFHYYLSETYLNPTFITAPAFRASIRMASPPGHFPTAYPNDWRQGAEAFGRNYGDAMAQRISFQTARFVSGAFIHEDPRYTPSSSHNPCVRSLHAFGYTFIDRSDSGHRMPAFSNFVGAASAGFVGNTYLPPGFANVTHAGQRATLQFALFGASNLYREFAPQMPSAVRTFIELIGR